MKVAMLVVTQDLVHDNRVRREAETLAAQGADVHVIAWTKSELPPGSERLEYVRVGETRTDLKPHRRRVAQLTEAYRASRTPLRRARLALAELSLRLASLQRDLRKLRLVGAKLTFRRVSKPLLEELRPDVVHAHDLKTLYAGARYARSARVPLVYDAHELELHTMQIRSRRDRAIAWLFERYGIRRSARVITVADEIADEIARVYRIPKPAVILNTPSIETSGLRPAATLRELAGLDGEARIVAYLGAVNAHRGVVQLAQSLAYLPDTFHLVVVGPRGDAFDQELLRTPRVHLLPSVPGADVPALLSTADVSVIPYPGTCRSHELCRPNKLFESLMAGVPIVVSRRPGLVRFVEENELGATFDEADPASIAAAIRAVVDETPAALRDPARLRALQERYSWEAQQPVLAEVYRSVTAA